MRLKEHLNVAAQVCCVLAGLVLLAAVIVSNWTDWAGVAAGKTPPVGFVLINLVALPLALFVMLWAFVGETRIWDIEGDHVRTHTVSLTRWRHTERLDPREIAAVRAETYDYGDRGRRKAHWLVMELSDGRAIRSPMSHDAAAIRAARQSIETVISQRTDQGA